MYEDNTFSLVEIVAGATLIIVCCVTLAFIFTSGNVKEGESYKAIISMGDNESTVVDVENYVIQSSGLAVIKSKDGKEYQTNNYTIIKNGDE